MNQGFIKINRELEYWQWADDLLTVGFLTRLILKANYEDRKWKNIVVKRGQFISSIDKMADEFKLTVNQIRTLLKRLNSCGEITSQTTNRYTVYTVVKYNKFQDVNHNLTHQTTSQTTHQTTSRNTTLKEDKEVKKDTSNEVSYAHFDFEEFWQIFPRKKDKKKAKEVFMRILAREKTDEDRNEKFRRIIEGARRFNIERSGQDPTYTAWASTWLNGERWEDEPSKDEGSSRGRDSKPYERRDGGKPSMLAVGATLMDRYRKDEAARRGDAQRDVQGSDRADMGLPETVDGSGEANPSQEFQAGTEIDDIALPDQAIHDEADSWHRE